MDRPDPLGRAMFDYQQGQYERGDLRYVDGERTEIGHVQEYYFGDPFDLGEIVRERDRFLRGPVLDVGCGAGRDAIRLQQDHRTLAIDVSPHAVQAARDRGVRNAAVMDMFDLGVPDGSFGSVCALGTQIGIAGSLPGIAGVLAEFGRVVGGGGHVAVDAHDPTAGETPFGYRPDARAGLARRAFHFEYGDLTGRTLEFLLLSPDRFREAATAAGWTVRDVLRKQGAGHYVVLLER
ncbi:MAG: class I SAM-dependent methyltransferase [Halobacteriales archaeon]